MIRKMRRRRREWPWVSGLVGAAIFGGCMLWLYTMIRMVTESTEALDLSKLGF